MGYAVLSRFPPTSRPRVRRRTRPRGLQRQCGRPHANAHCVRLLPGFRECKRVRDSHAFVERRDPGRVPVRRDHGPRGAMGHRLPAQWRRARDPAGQGRGSARHPDRTEVQPRNHRRRERRRRGRPPRSRGLPHLRNRPDRPLLLHRRERQPHRADDPRGRWIRFHDNGAHRHTQGWQPQRRAHQVGT